MPVGFRIPLVVVDSVENAAQLRRPRAKETVQAEPEFGSLDFAGISRADGVDGIRPHNACLQEIEAAEKLQAFRMEQSGIETKVGNRGSRKTSLITQVVDSENAADAEERWIER